MLPSGSADRSPLEPLDAQNQTLIENVHPTDWTNPLPADRYHLVVIGSGTAGLVAASFAAGAGARVALIERDFMGGDCLNAGCVPSKSIIRSSRVYAELRDAAALGWHIPTGVVADFEAVMARMRRIRARLSQNDSASRYRDEKGVDVFFGSARFTSETTLDVAGATIRFKKALIATGARPARLLIPGLAETGYLTNETVFNLTARPNRLAVIGGGPVGSELAQAFCRLGSQVTLLEASDQVLVREDPDAAAIVQAAMGRDGVKVFVKCAIERFERQNAGKVIHFTCGGPREVTVDEILVGTGRTPNTDGLGLDMAGVNYSSEGIIVDDALRTSNSRIYAAGDICMDWKFTHAAEDAARIAVQNALFLGRRRLSVLTMPWCTYTDPAVAHVGMYEHQASTQDVSVSTYTHHWRDVDRAIVDGEEDGFVRIHTRKGMGEILGATIVARNAGDMIGEVTLAMLGGLGLGTLANVIHPYPTAGDALRRVAFEYKKTQLTPFLKRLLGVWLKVSE